MPDTQYAFGFLGRVPQHGQATTGLTGDMMSQSQLVPRLECLRNGRPQHALSVHENSFEQRERLRHATSALENHREVSTNIHGPGVIRTMMTLETVEGALKELHRRSRKRGGVS